MINLEVREAILDSLKDPLVFVDTNHTIQYMNEAAIRHYEEGVNLIGRPIFECHNEQSNRIIVEIFSDFENGTEERLITDNEKHRIYMRAVRDIDGQLLGYYERYEPPAVLTTIGPNGQSN
jgi:DUF438 domain-containing protein